MPHGKKAMCVAIVRSGRPRFGVSPGATPSQDDILSKNDALKKCNDAERRHHSMQKPKI
jgi:hypothetical protein